MMITDEIVDCAQASARMVADVMALNWSGSLSKQADTTTASITIAFNNQIIIATTDQPTAPLFIKAF